MGKKNNLIDVWFFTTLVFIISIAVGLFHKRIEIMPLSAVTIFIGLLGFFFWVFVNRKPITEIFSKGYPYRKLKVWGAILSIVFF